MHDNGGSGTFGNGVMQVLTVKIEDVTESNRALNAASAAALSYTNADARATDSSTSATASEGSSLRAATSYTAAQQIANTLIPERVSLRTNFVTSLTAGSPESETSLLTDGVVMAVALEGDVVQFVGGIIHPILTRGALPVVTGRTYRRQIRVRVTSNGTANIVRTGWVVYDSSWAVLSTIYTVDDSVFDMSDGWKTFSLDVKTADLITAQPTATYVRPLVQTGINAGGTTSGATWQIAFLRFADVTSEAAATGSALAAAEHMTDAQGYSDAAQSSASASETSRLSADTTFTATKQVASQLFPADFALNGRFWSNTFVNEITLDPTVGTFTDVSGVGRVYAVPGTGTGYTDIAPKGYITPIAGRRYRVTARVRLSVAAANGGTSQAGIDFVGLTSAFASTTLVGTREVPNGNVSFKNLVTTDGWVIIVRDLVLPVGSTPNPFVRPRLFVNYNGGTGGYGNGTSQVHYLKIEDVTESFSSAGSAQAAALSANDASSYSDSARDYATSSTTQANIATTARTTATNVAAQLLPSDFSQDGLFFTNDVSGQSPASVSKGIFVTI